MICVCGSEPLLEASISKFAANRIHCEKFNAVDRSEGAIVEAFDVTFSR